MLASLHHPCVALCVALVALISFDYTASQTAMLGVPFPFYFPIPSALYHSLNKDYGTINEGQHYHISVIRGSCVLSENAFR